MAEPLRRNENIQPVTRPNLRALDGGGETTQPQKGHLAAASKDSGSATNSSDSGNRANLRLIQGGEESGATDSGKTAGADNETKILGNTSPWFNQNKDTSTKGDSLFSRLRGKVTKKRSIIGFAVTGLVGGGFMGLSIISGPAQLVQLGEWLQKPSFGSEKNSGIRLTAAWRYYKTGDIGETRVSALGSKIFHETMENLEKSGVTYDRDSSTGKVKTQTIDTSKNSQLRGKSVDEIKGILAREYGLPESRFQQIGMGANGTGFKIATNLRDMSIGDERKFHFKTLSFFNDTTGLKHLGDGKIVVGMQQRVVAKFFNIPSLWNGLKRVVASQANKYSTKAERRAAEKERMDTKMNPITERLNIARGKLRDRLSGKTGLFASGASLGTTAMCIVRDSAEDVAETNRQIARLAAAEAADKKSLASQVKSNINTTLESTGAVVTGFTDPKTDENIWSSKPLKSLGDPNNTKGVDLPNEYQQAFMPGSTEKEIKDTIGGGAVGAAACSPVGIAAQLVVGIGLLIAGPVSGGASWAVIVAQQGASMAATAGATYLIGKLIVEHFDSDTIMPSPLSGPLGGGLLAYGSMELENIASRPSGGVPMSKDDLSALRTEQLNESQNEFRSKSTIAQLFDINDYRTPAGQLVASISPDISHNVRNTASLFTKIPSMFSSTLTKLIPAAHAEGEYEWPMDIVGVPREIINDPNLENPNDNADKLAAVLDSPSGNGYIDKAKKCFGVEISKGPEGWDAITQDEVNPNSEEYVNANCGDISDYNWKRTILFVFDIKTLTAAACFQGDEESCTKLNINSGSASGSGSAGGSASVVDGTEKELAQKLLDYHNQGKYKFDNPTDEQDLQMMVRGESIRGGVGCVADKLDKRVMQLLIYVIDSGYEVGTYALCRSHHYNQGAHPQGKAVDISSLNGIPLNSSAAKSVTLEVSQLIFNLNNELRARQIIIGGVGATRTVDQNFVRYNRCSEGIEGAAAVACFGAETMAGHTDHIHVGY